MSRHHHGHASTNLRHAFLLNLGFTLFEILGGLWTNSLAILADAVHDLGDASSLGFAWYLQRLSESGPDKFYTYGYRRFSVLGAVVTAVSLLVGLGFVLWHAVVRIFDPQPVVPSGMLLLAVVGIAVNGAAAWRTAHGRTFTERLVTWHLLEDVLGWVAILIGAAILTVRDWPIIDPLLSLIIAAVVLFNIVRNSRPVLAVFLQRAPANFDVDRFEEALLSFPGVRDVHHTHVWTLDGEHHVLTTHVVLPQDSSREAVLAVKQFIRESVDRKQFEHVTVDVEFEGECCISESS